MVRFWLAGLVQGRTGSAFPLGTFLVNLSGCFVFGFLYFLFVERAALLPEIRALVFIGFLGGYTTFSSWSFETLGLLREKSYTLAAWYALGSPVAGLAATWAGAVLARALLYLISGRY